MSVKVIATNPVARANYFIEEVVEAGMVLTGTEVKSIRDQAPNLRDSHIDVRSGASSGAGIEAWVYNIHIAPYQHGNIWNHEPTRKRKLLLHRYQIAKLFGAINRKGLAIVPTKMYFKKGRVKLEIALAKGKKKHDKRDTLRKKSADREMDIARKQRRK